jgi:hypothetical protein
MRNSLGFFCLAVSAACLAWAYLPRSSWVGALMVCGASLVLLAALIRPVRGMASIGLVLYTILAGLRMLEGGSALLLAGGTTAALAWWELVEFRRRQRTGITPGSTATVEVDASLSKTHLQSLGLAVGLGLSLIGIGWGVRLPLPFGIVVGLVLGLFWALTRVLRWFVAAENPTPGSPR